MLEFGPLARWCQLPVLLDLIHDPGLGHLEDEVVEVLLELRVRIETESHWNRYLVLEGECHDPGHPRPVEGGAEIHELGIGL